MSRPEELDFLFLYEHKVRELENVCLMAYELNRRGYTTKIVYVNDAQNALAVKPIYHAKVLCVMACYGNRTLRWHVKEFVKFDKVIDLQWENIVYPKDEEAEEAYKNYTGIGKDVVHISWGDQNVKRLLGAAHIDPEKIKMTGHVGMDFLREPLSGYYMSREELFCKYGIDPECKAIFFASPFYGDSLSEEYIAEMCFRFGDNWRDYYRFMIDSQVEVLKWFEKVCLEDPKCTIIYRPHPGHPSNIAEDLAKRVPNFRLISDESVKQWIVTCDKIYTGNSSVIVEAYFAKKDCQLLFPIEITPGFELKLFDGARKIRTYEEFEKSLNDTGSFPIPKSNIEEIYSIDWDVPSYQRFADAAEDVLKNDKYRLTKKQIVSYKEYSPATRLIKAICRIDPIYNVYLNLINNEGIKWKFIENQRRIRQKAIDDEKNDCFECATDAEIQQIMERIEKAFKE